MLAPRQAADPDLDQVAGANGRLYVLPLICAKVGAMNDSELRSLLTQLHARLGSAQSLDADDKELLATVLGDIQNALARNPASAPPDTSGLESLAVKFEADHPALADGLRRLADTLGKAGI